MEEPRGEELARSVAGQVKAALASVGQALLELDEAGVTQGEEVASLVNADAMLTDALILLRRRLAP